MTCGDELQRAVFATNSNRLADRGRGLRAVLAGRQDGKGKIYETAVEALFGVEQRDWEAEVKSMRQTDDADGDDDAPADAVASMRIPELDHGYWRSPALLQQLKLLRGTPPEYFVRVVRQLSVLPASIESLSSASP